MSSGGHRAWRWLAGSVAALAIVAALAVGAFRLALEMLPEYEARVADRVREATGLRLSFDSLDARIGRYGPEIFFLGARIVGPDGSEVLVSADAGRASLSVLRSIWFRRLEIGRIVLEAPRLNLVIFPDRHIELVGQAGLTRPELKPRGEQGLDRVPRGVIEIRNASIGFVDLRAARGAWELSNVDLELRRKGDEVALTGRVGLPEQLGRYVDLRAAVSGDLADLRAVDWQVRVEARDVRFAGWADLLPETFSVPPSGAGSFRVSGRGSGTEFERGRVVFELRDVTLPGTEDAASDPVVYRRLAADLTLRRQDREWRVSGGKLELAMPGADWTPTDIDAAVELADGRFVSGRLRAGFLRVDNLVPLLALAPPSQTRDWVERLAPRGTFRRVDVLVTNSGAGQIPDVRGVLEFEDLGLRTYGRVPGLTGIDGRLRGAGAEGVIELFARDVEVDWPKEWRAPVSFAKVDARLAWRRALGGVQLSTDDAVIDAGHARASGRLRMLVRPGQSPLMDIVAQASGEDLSQVSRYLSRDRISAKALDWLDAAFLQGRLVEADVEITGPARGFPYREGQGRFHADARVEDTSLRFAPDWDPATNISAAVEFDGSSMRVNGASGEIGGIRFSDARAEVLDWRQSILTIRAGASADASAVHSFLAGSPLGPRLGETFARLSAAGQIDGEVVMYLPLKQFADRAVTVRALARGVTLSLPGLAEPLTGVTGEVWVRDREIQAPSLAGRVLGGQAAASVVTVGGPGGRLVTTVKAQGRADGSLLPRVVRLPLDSGLAGLVAWRGSWQLTRPADPEGETRGQVRIESDLAGLASGLPAPFGKQPADQLPLQIDLDLDGNALIARGRLGRGVRALVELRKGEAGYGLSSGVVRFGGAEVGLLPVEPGLRIDGRLPRVSLSELTALRWERPGRTPLEDLLSGVSLEIGRLEVLGYEFDRLKAELRPGNRAWDIEVSAPAAEGQLRVPYAFPGDVPLVLDMDRLYVPASSRQGEGDPDPRQLPSIRVDVRDLDFIGRRLGHFTAEIRHGEDGLALEQLAVEHPAFKATGLGSWRVLDGRPGSALELDIEIGDVAGFLEALTLAPLIEGRKGKVEADVNWSGGPDDGVLERVSGRVRLALFDGRIRSVEPGAGRILGLMSIAHLPRRLSLDFDDLTGQGLAFDSIKGDFALAQGDAYTDNLTLRGAAAEIGIAGRTSIRERTYDQTAVVTGDLGASLGVAGAIAGGPAVGAALLLFSQIFKEPLKGVARGYYRISGPWEDPLVRKIDARELEEAAGLGLPPATRGDAPDGDS